MSTFTPYLLIAYLTTMLSADLKYARQRFKQLSETDDMTGLHNLRSFNYILTIEIAKSIRYEHAFSILMADVDNLKTINDNYGHDARNQLIIIIANAIQSCLRNSDTLSRYGGDEFIILLPETNRENALEASERIKQAVANTAFDMKGNQIKTTISIGIASFPDDSVNAEELLQKADRSMYQSKKNDQ